MFISQTHSDLATEWIWTGSKGKRRAKANSSFLIWAVGQMSRWLSQIREKKEGAYRETIWDGFQGCCAVGAYGHPNRDEPSDMWL